MGSAVSTTARYTAAQLASLKQHKKAMAGAEQAARELADLCTNEELKVETVSAFCGVSMAWSKTATASDADLGRGGNGCVLLTYRVEELAEIRYRTLSECLDMRDF